MTAEVRDELSGICRIIDETISVDKIYLFGSHAYGTPGRDSDFDLCVIIPDGTLRPVDAVKKIRRALFPTQTTPLDLIVYNAGTFLQRQESAPLERKIASEGVLLFERKGLERRMV